MMGCFPEPPEVALEETLETIIELLDQPAPEKPLEAGTRAAELVKFYKKHTSPDFTASWKEEPLDIPEPAELLRKFTTFRKVSTAFELQASMLDEGKLKTREEFYLAKVKVDALGSLVHGEGNYYESHLLKVVFRLEGSKVILEHIEHWENLRE